MKPIIPAAVALCLAAAPALAQDSTADNGSGGLEGYLSLGAGMTPEFEGSTSYEAVPYAEARVNAGNYYAWLEAAAVRFNVIDSESFHAGPLVGFRRGRGNYHNAIVSSLYNINDSGTAGAFVEYEHFADDPRSGERVTLAFDDDVTGENSGWSIIARAEIHRPLVFINPGFIVAAAADVTFASENYMTTYFGVDARNAAASGLPLYKVGAGVKSVGIGVSADQFLSRNWAVGLRGYYERLMDDAADSPIVRRHGTPDQFYGGFAITYVL